MRLGGSKYARAVFTVRQMMGTQVGGSGAGGSNAQVQQRLWVSVVDSLLAEEDAEAAGAQQAS